MDSLEDIKGRSPDLKLAEYNKDTPYSVGQFNRRGYKEP